MLTACLLGLSTLAFINRNRIVDVGRAFYYSLITKTLVYTSGEFTFRYPLGYYIRECGSSIQISDHKMNPCNFEDDDVATFGVTKWDGPIDDYIKAGENDYYHVTEKDIVVSGKFYKQFISTLKETAPQNMPGLSFMNELVVFPDTNHSCNYVIGYSQERRDDPDHSNDYQALLSSFKLAK